MGDDCRGTVPALIDETIGLGARTFMVVAQASREGMHVVSRDPKLDVYPATRVWDRVYEKAQ